LLFKVVNPDVDTAYLTKTAGTNEISKNK